MRESVPLMAIYVGMCNVSPDLLLPLPKCTCPMRVLTVPNVIIDQMIASECKCFVIYRHKHSTAKCCVVQMPSFPSCLAAIELAEFLWYDTAASFLSLRTCGLTGH